MAKPTLLLHPQFFHTLVPGFNTHLTIPLEFFSKYIEGKTSVEKTTAELKSDSSDITWKVKMTGRRLSDGWEEFAVANNFRTGDVVVVRYEGDMVFHVSDLGSSCCEIQDIPPLSNNSYGQDDIGKNLLKKRLHPRTQVVFSSNDVDDEDNLEIPVKKKAKKNSPEAEEVSSSSSDDSCFVAMVTPSSLRTDKLYLPQYVTNSSGITRKCRKIVLTDGEERSWALDLRFSKSSDSFYISRGWRKFCEENGREAESFFMFKLVRNGETPVLGFCPSESCNDKRQRNCSEASGRESFSTEISSGEENIEGESSEDDCSSMESLMETKEKKCSLKRRILSCSSYSPRYKRFVTFTLPPDYDRIRRLCLPRSFLRENGINKTGEIYLLGKDGKKWLTNLQRDKNGTMKMEMGLKDFVKANGLKMSESFTLELIWEDTTPMLSLCPAECSIDRGAGGECSETDQENSLSIEPSSYEKISKDENKSVSTKPRSRDSSSAIQNRFAELTLTPEDVRACKLVSSSSNLHLPRQFMKANGIGKLGKITMLGKEGTKCSAFLLSRDGFVALGIDWKWFCEANGVRTGESFTLEFISEQTKTTYVLKFCSRETNKYKIC
ncbi:hypothetical protein EUTSA_v10000097mg [Eutrema salsugineum]|uniref:TF-B3 domain-containing protein n=1 Tax=Eutrema salsugineum TaxID=72664 RepID=V4L7W8_EUTSA|nr:hypothetical protein EUTSA_v10000097mg [Eutrema salsugineum]